jgi:hypothetical protein
MARRDKGEPGLRRRPPLWKVYERQIYDGLRAKAAPDADVTFDDGGRQRLQGRYSGTDRQIDVIVRGHFASLDGEQLMIVDCKCFARPINVIDVEAFGGLVDDVGADLGLLVTTNGYSDAAKRRAEHIRGMRIDVVKLDDLARWVPLRPTVGMTAGSSSATLSVLDGDTLVTGVVDPTLAGRVIGAVRREGVD